MAKHRPRGGGQVGGEVRPTTQRILESMSGTLMPRLDGAEVLDVFAGTGRVGMEMLDQGARRVVFVEGHRRVAQELRKAMSRHPQSAKMELVIGAVPGVLSKVLGEFDLVLCDPPYDWDLPDSLLPAAAGLTRPGGLLCVEHHHKVKYDACEGWELFRYQKFGETRLSYFERTALPVEKPNQPGHS